MFYGATKVAVEHLGAATATCYGMEVITSARPGSTGRPAAHRVPKNLIDAALAGRPLHVPSVARDSRIDHTYVDDFVDGTLAALDCARHPFDVYNLASGTARRSPRWRQR